MYQVAGLDMYQLTMDSTEDTAVFNAVDGARCQRVQGNAVDYAAECKWSRVMKQSRIARAMNLT